MKTRIIAIVALKGGTAKTTTAVNLGAALVARRRRVLLIDLDPQRDLSDALRVQPSDAQPPLSQILVEDIQLTRAVTEVHGLAVVPADVDLAAVEMANIGDQILAPKLRAVTREYDYILIDCPKGLGLLTLNALHAAGEILLPTPTEFLAVRRLADLLNRLREAGAIGPKLQILGVLPTMAMRTRHSQDAHAELIQQYGRTIRVYDPIPRTVRFPESTLAGMSLIHYAPEHPGAGAYHKLGKEIDR